MILTVSNNPMVLEQAERTKTGEDILPVKGTPLDVLYKTLELLASGKYSLAAHPVAGNERLLRNPFRTVLLESGTPSDERLLARQAAYVDRTLNKMEQIDYSVTPEDALEDYKLVDYDLYRCILK